MTNWSAVVAAKNVSSFYNVKATHIFSPKHINVFALFQGRLFNIVLANNFIKFWTIGPWMLGKNLPGGVLKYFPQRIGFDISCKLSSLHEMSEPIFREK